jgi:hypothetical protein
MKAESVFELGLLGLAAAVLAGLAIFFGGEALGEALRRRRQTERTPAPSTIRAGRHQHVLGPAAR